MFDLVYRCIDVFKGVIIVKSFFVGTVTQLNSWSAIIFHCIFLVIFTLFLFMYKKIIPHMKKICFSSFYAVKNIFISRSAQKITHIDRLDKSIAAAGYAYNANQDVFYSKIDAWQRHVGYCRLYDEAAPAMGMIIDSEPIFFEYDHKKWLIEFWKGQYDLTCGGEIGVYTTQKKDVQIQGVFEGTFYDCASNSDMLYMSFALKKHGKTLFTRKGIHWWLTGFRLGEHAAPEDLTMVMKIRLKNEKMRNAFIKGLLNAGYSENEIEVSGNTVHIVFDEPKTKQPITRSKETDKIILNNTKELCVIYQNITAPYDTMPEKVMAIRNGAPQVYKHILNIGKNEQIFFKSDIIRQYIGGELNENTMVELNNLYNTAKRITFDNNSKFAIMSDVHRGVGTRSDDFKKNKTLYLSVLKRYYKSEYTYIELGDGEELWENNKLAKIVETYQDIYLLFKKFYAKGRLYFIYGNHDIAKRNKKYIKENLYNYYDKHTQSYRCLFKGIQAHEALVLRHEGLGGNIFLIHGHQADFFNNKLWRLARILLKVLWKPLEYIGIQDPTRTAKVYRKKLSVERKLTEWIIENNHMLIAGHTHKPMFSDIGIPPYFNDGSCVSKGGITAIEIECGKISLVRWFRSEGKTLKEVLAGPVELEKYFVTTSKEKNIA